MSTTARKSRLAGAMQKKAQIGDDAEAPETTEPQPAKPATPLALAPQPAEQPESSVEDQEVADEETPDAEARPETAEGAVDQADPEAAAEPPMRDDAVEPEPAPAEAVAPAARRPEPAASPRQRAQVLAGSGQVDMGAAMVHLRRVMDNGRDQRRYVEDLPRRSDKGTYLRLPIHLQDTLAEYCDRNVAPMADFIAAVLDAYFRDIELLPPLGEGHRPNEKMLDKIRKQSRTYDY